MCKHHKNTFTASFNTCNVSVYSLYGSSIKISTLASINGETWENEFIRNLANANALYDEFGLSYFSVRYTNVPY